MVNNFIEPRTTKVEEISFEYDGSNNEFALLMTDEKGTWGWYINGYKACDYYFSDEVNVGIGEYFKDISIQLSGYREKPLGQSVDNN